MSELAPPTYALTRWLFLRLLAVVFLIAFVSYWVQLDGLIGSQGILPAADLMRSVRGLGASGVWRVPTLCWLGASDGFLHAGLRVPARSCRCSCWRESRKARCLPCCGRSICRLVVVGQVFFSFQWDILLLETALTSMFVAAWTLRPRLMPEGASRRTVARSARCCSS